MNYVHWLAVLHTSIQLGHAKSFSDILYSMVICDLVHRVIFAIIVVNPHASHALPWTHGTGWARLKSKLKTELYHIELHFRYTLLTYDL